MVEMLKLVTGDDIIAKCTNHGEKITLENPVKIIYTQQGIGMIPYVSFYKSNKLVIAKEHIVFYGEVTEEIFNTYNEKFGSGLVLAKSNLRLAGTEDD